MTHGLAAPTPAHTRLFSFPVVLVAALLASVFLVSTGPQLGPRILSDPDIWWHLRNAEYVVTTGHFIHRDFYSFSTSGTAWMNPEWLSELPYYFAWKSMGELGLYLVLLIAMATIILGIFYLAYAKTRNVKSAFLVSWLGILLASISFAPRTVLFGWICLIIELIVLWKFRHGKDFSWILPLLFAIWINAHGSWLIGIVFLLVFIASAAMRGSSGAGKLTLIAILSVAALFVNPYGWRLVVYPFDFAFHLKVTVSLTQEWQSLDFHSSRGKLLLIMVGLVVLLYLVRPRRWPLQDLLFGAIALYSALTYVRFLVLAAIVICPLLATDFSFVRLYNKRRDRPLFNAAILLALLAAVFVRFPSRAQLRDSAAQGFPSGALTYLEKVAPQGRLLNDYDWGGYLIWNARQIPVFIDSRVDIFEHRGVLADYLSAVNLQNPLDILAKYSIRYVLFRKDAPLVYLLKHLPDWKIDYEDGTAVLLEHTDATVATACALVHASPVS